MSALWVTRAPNSHRKEKKKGTGTVQRLRQLRASWNAMQTFGSTGDAKETIKNALNEKGSATWTSSTRHLYFSESSASWPPRILSSLAFNFASDLPRQFLKGSSRMVTRMGKCQDRSVGRIQRSVSELQDSSRLTNIIILVCNHGIVDVFRFWINLSSNGRQQAFNGLAVRVCLPLVSCRCPVSAHASCSRVFS